MFQAPLFQKSSVYPSHLWEVFPTFSGFLFSAENAAPFWFLLGSWSVFEVSESKSVQDFVEIMNWLIAWKVIQFPSHLSASSRPLHHTAGGTAPQLSEVLASGWTMGSGPVWKLWGGVKSRSGDRMSYGSSTDWRTLSSYVGGGCAEKQDSLFKLSKVQSNRTGFVFISY